MPHPYSHPKERGLGVGRESLSMPHPYPHPKERGLGVGRESLKTVRLPVIYWWNSTPYLICFLLVVNYMHYWKYFNFFENLFDRKFFFVKYIVNYLFFILNFVFKKLIMIDFLTLNVKTIIKKFFSEVFKEKVLNNKEQPVWWRSQKTYFLDSYPGILNFQINLINK